MDQYPFIFSDKIKYRLQRHLLFWLCWWIFQTFLYSFSAGLLNTEYFQRLTFSAIQSFLYLVPHIFLSYSLMYFVVPKLLLKGKYAITVFAVAFLFILTGAISSLISLYPVNYLRYLFSEKYYIPQYSVTEINFFLGLLAGLRGAITIGGLAAAIKLMKHWYVKEQKALKLEKENITSQLNLLKAQVHPHFLFNTLNNIYAHTQKTAPVAASMIIGLSDLLRYILYECNQPLVPLKKELEMLQDYMLLEQKRYGNGLELHIDIPKNTENFFLAPLLLLPFVENCFKHGTSHVLDQPWINLQITIEEDILKMKLVNGQLADNTISSTGIGLQNVKKRLQLLYHEKHQLVINSEKEVFIVNLKLQLERKQMTTTTNIITTNPVINYA